MFLLESECALDIATDLVFQLMCQFSGLEQRIILGRGFMSFFQDFQVIFHPLKLLPSFSLFILYYVSLFNAYKTPVKTNPTPSLNKSMLKVILNQTFLRFI
jgi:hypothetical protein